LIHQSALKYLPGLMTATSALDLRRLAPRFRARADERIIDLHRGGEWCGCDLTAAVATRQSLLSFHLKTLKNAGLVTGRRAGRWSYYALNREAFRQLQSFVCRLTSGRRSTLTKRRCV
jgi:ArsR family transcriptional regulator